MGEYSQFGVTIRDTGSSLEAVVLGQSLFLILPGTRSPTQENKLTSLPSWAPSLVQALHIWVISPIPHRAKDIKERRGLCSCSEEGAGALYKSREETTRRQRKAAVVCEGGYALPEWRPRENYLGKCLSSHRSKAGWRGEGGGDFTCSHSKSSSLFSPPGSKKGW